MPNPTMRSSVSVIRPYDATRRSLATSNPTFCEPRHGQSSSLVVGHLRKHGLAAAGIVDRMRLKCVDSSTIHDVAKTATDHQSDGQPLACLEGLSTRGEAAHPQRHTCIGNKGEVQAAGKQKIHQHSRAAALAP